MPSNDIPIPIFCCVVIGSLNISDANNTKRVGDALAIGATIEVWPSDIPEFNAISPPRNKRDEKSTAMRIYGCFGRRIFSLILKK